MNIEDAIDLAILCEAIKILTGESTHSLWVPIEKFEVKDINGEVVGHFVFTDEENFEFVTTTYLEED